MTCDGAKMLSTTANQRSRGNEDAAAGGGARRRTRRAVVWFLGLAVLFLLWQAGGVPVAQAHVLWRVNLRVQHSGKCMDVKWGWTDDKTDIWQWPCNGSLAQSMYMGDSGGGWHEFAFWNSGKCLDVKWGSHDDGTPLWLWPCNGSDAQLFTVASSVGGTSVLKNKGSGKCVEVEGGSMDDGALLKQYPCDYASNQLWMLREVGVGTFTGYAMGNQYGAAGVEVAVGHFANHSPTYCPNDPAAPWPFGTQITTASQQGPFHNPSSGSSYYRYTFYLEDTGDTSCSMGNYWADLYFGRHKRSSEPCYCGGVSGYCYTSTVVNHCTDATNYGAPTNVLYRRY